MDPNYPATVSDFNLDKYEITVGRFRVFVNAGMGTQANPPAAGAGAPPGIAGSGWDSTWNTNLPANTAALTTNLKCGSAYQTWTDTAGGNESKPVNCLDWYTAFAFCAWDGGRLATEAEWNYAASGGSEQRSYPWSNPATSTTINDSYAVYCGGSCSGTQNVGSKSPTGDGKWGQSDLAGNVWEWTLDWYASPYSMPCNNCADLTAASSRVIRGGSFDNFASDLRSAGRRGSDYRGSDNYVVGSRCARSVSGTPGTGGAGGAAGSAGGSDAGMAGAGGGGGTPTTLASGQNGPSGIVVDAASVYWLNRGNGTVMSVPIGGGTPTTLASGQNNPNGIAIDATSVYWVNWGDGTVMKTLISGGTPTALASGQNSATAGSAIAVDGTSVYWTSAPSGTVMKLTPK